MSRLQALIFDLDGTLIDSAPDLRQALNLTLKGHGRRPVTLDEVKTMVGDGMLPMLNRAFAATGLAISDSQSYERFQEFVTHYRKLIADPSQIYPYVVETLEGFQAQGIKLGICTNKQALATVKLVEELGLKNFFGFIAGGDSFPVHKPHPGHVLGVLDGLQVTAADCVMVGDSVNDVIAAQKAGVRCVVVTHGYGIGVEKLGADGIIESFSELPPVLRSLGFELV